MIIVKLKGGLGNQLFQYSFGRLLSLKRNEELKIDCDFLKKNKDTYRNFGLDNFNIDTSIATSEEIKQSKLPVGIFSRFLGLVSKKIFKKYYIGFEENILKSKENYFEGYFQSYKYLEPIRKELLKEIALKDSGGLKPIEGIGERNSVSIHIRRGDYVDDVKTRKDHYICDLPYYYRAIKLIKEKVFAPVFFIFSDDIEWVKENLKTDEKIVFVSNPEIKDFEELILMSKCHHNIISNSSFSFWGAWLNQAKDKIVIAPDRWNNKYKNEYKDLLHPDWMKINTN